MVAVKLSLEANGPAAEPIERVASVAFHRSDIDFMEPLRTT